jgi:hypothetical protein
LAAPAPPVSTSPGLFTVEVSADVVDVVGMLPSEVVVSVLLVAAALLGVAVLAGAAPVSPVAVGALDVGPTAADSAADVPP